MPEESQPVAAAPVVVTPIPAAQSRTMWLAKGLATIGAVLALLPDLLTDPMVTAYMKEFVSPGTRRTIGFAMFVLGFVMRELRRRTSAPIAGTPTANALMQPPTEGGGKR